jgi:HD-like signal output (HDOD) protein
MSSILTPLLPRIAQPWALRDLPPFRPVAMKLLRLSAREDVPILEILRILRTDAAFSGEVLRLANSALTGSRTEVHSVAHAVAVLGLDQIRALSMTIALRDVLPVGKAGGFLHQCWQYNLATAILAEWLGRGLPLTPDACYTAGLVHDIGRLAILRAYPDMYEKAVALLPDYEFDLLRCEKDVFDIDHCEAGAWLMDHWGFPAGLRDAAALHHLAPTAETPLLITVVHIAWQMADMLGLSPMATRSATTIEELTATLPETARQRIFAGFDELPALVSQKLAAAELIPA